MAETGTKVVGIKADTRLIGRKAGGSECCFCELPIDEPGCALPMYEGEPVSRDATEGEWGGFDCCRPCYEAYQAADLVGLKIRWAAIKDMRLIRARVKTMIGTAKAFVQFLEDEQV